MTGDGGDASLEGRHLGRYQVQQVVARGGMGEVYRAHDTQLGRMVALKVIRHEHSAKPEFQARFLREARSAAALNHPAVATLLDFGEADGVLYGVYEFLQGQTLREAVRSRPSVSACVRMVMRVAQALEAAQRAGIVHRDIKPDNIMVLSDGGVKVLDFGLAKPAVSTEDLSRAPAGSTPGNLTGEGKLLGTLGYMSPEQLKGEPVDTRSDIFSLGIVFYELVTGARPFAHVSGAVEVANILQANPAPPGEMNPDVPSALEGIILKCLSGTPAARYQNAADLVTDLRRFQEGLSPEAHYSQEADFFLPRNPARFLFGALQFLYMGMYVASFYWLDLAQASLAQAFGVASPDWLPGGILFTALLGLAVRLYLLTLVIFDHAHTGVRFRKAFPFFFVLDELWAMMPFALIGVHGIWVALACFPPLVFLPFSQRTLLGCAYHLGQARRTKNS